MLTWGVSQALARKEETASMMEKELENLKRKFSVVIHQQVSTQYLTVPRSKGSKYNASVSFEGRRLQRVSRKERSNGKRRRAIESGERGSGKSKATGRNQASRTAGQRDLVHMCQVPCTSFLYRN